MPLYVQMPQNYPESLKCLSESQLEFIKTRESLIALGLSLRNQNIILNAGVNSVDDLLKLSTEDLSKMHNLGKKGIYQIKNTLKESYNIELMDLVSRAKNSKRNITKRQKKILDMWNSAEHTYESIGEIFGVSRERIRQILAQIKRKGFQVISTKEASMGRRENFLYKQRKHIDDDEFAKMFHLGSSQEEMCTHFSINQDAYREHETKLIEKGVISNRKRILDSIKFDIENVDEISRYREDTIMQMREDGHRLDDIASALELSKIRLSQIIKNMKDKGYSIPNSRMTGNPLSDEEIIERVNKIEHCLDKGMNVRQISHLINVSPHVIKRLIYKHLIKSS